MKRIIFTLAFNFIILMLKANPVAVPQLYISELYFDSTKNWVIELAYSSFPDSTDNFFRDSLIMLSSSEGTVGSKKLHFKGSEGYKIITKDSLVSDLVINPTSDYIHIQGYFYSYDSLIFGDYKNSHIKKPKNGESIARCFTEYPIQWSENEIEIYSLDNSPTIGKSNDTLGECGTLRGKIFDINNNIISKKFSFGANFAFNMDGNGNYYTRIFSDTITKHFISLFSFIGYRILPINPISYTMTPDSIIYRDIHIQESFEFIDSLYKADSLFLNRNSVEKLNINSNALFKTYPNPLKTNLTFKYEISTPVKSTNCFIKLTDLNGKEIANYRISNNIGSLELSSEIKSGVYILQLILNNRNIASNRIIVNR